MKVGLFHEEEQEDEAHSTEYGTPVEHPLPALTVGYETCNDRSEKVAAG